MEPLELPAEDPTGHPGRLPTLVVHDQKTGELGLEEPLDLLQKRLGHCVHGVAAAERLGDGCHRAELPAVPGPGSEARPLAPAGQGHERG